MADILIEFFKRVLFRGAYKVGKQLGKELRDAPKILRNPPPYDELDDKQRIFAGSREEYEKKRREYLSR
jgi:hypothetical protein